ncbi:8822_t:CDS:2 [Racocetra fulgida]|uniref:8822_t:CDS:1 n=1 Tax=Racocetra fulgida TaxID=60492 RepID=A0A9N9AWA7_9GLOM|nr:8822_t:CDS:2 [Racocetra fulgida]
MNSLYNKQKSLEQAVQDPTNRCYTDDSYAKEAKRFVVNNKNILTVSALTIGGVVLVPIVFVGLVQAIGFGSGGIVAGSFAAWMMSLQGGATAAGATIATGAGGGSLIGFLSTLIMKTLESDPEGRAELNSFVRIGGDDDKGNNDDKGSNDDKDNNDKKGSDNNKTPY